MTDQAFFARSVHDVARDLVGCVLRHGAAAGRIVETESYHESEPACHAHIGLTARTHTLFREPGVAYVYRSYGIHALLNAVCEEEGIGAAVLIRALEPLEGLDEMRGSARPPARRGPVLGPRQADPGDGNRARAEREPCSRAGRSPSNRAPLRPGWSRGPRIGITKAAELPWRFCDADSRHVSRPWPAAMRRARSAAA